MAARGGCAPRRSRPAPARAQPARPRRAARRPRDRPPRWAGRSPRAEPAAASASSCAARASATSAAMCTSCPQACIASPSGAEGCVRALADRQTVELRAHARRRPRAHRPRGRAGRSRDGVAGTGSSLGDGRGRPLLRVRQLRLRVQAMAQHDGAAAARARCRTAAAVSSASVDGGIAPAHLAQVQGRDRLELGALEARVGVVQKRRSSTPRTVSSSASACSELLERPGQRADAEALGLGLVEQRRVAVEDRRRRQLRAHAVEPGAHDRAEREIGVRGRVGAAVLQAQLPCRVRAGERDERRNAQQRLAVLAAPGTPRRRSSGGAAGARPRAGSGRSARSVPGRGAGSRPRSARRARCRHAGRVGVVQRRIARRRRAG